MIRYTIAFGLILCFYNCKNDLSEIRDLGKSDFPITSAKNLNSVYTDSGLVSSKLQSSKMLNFSNLDFPYFEFPESVKITFYDKNKNFNTITADYLISYNNTDLVDMRNNIVIITSSKDTLFTDQLYYNKSQQWLFTNFPFRYKSLDKDISGIGFDSNIDFTQINFLDVNGYVYLDE